MCADTRATICRHHTYCLHRSITAELTSKKRASERDDFLAKSFRLHSNLNTLRSAPIICNCPDTLFFSGGTVVGATIITTARLHEINRVKQIANQFVFALVFLLSQRHSAMHSVLGVRMCVCVCAEAHCPDKCRLCSMQESAAFRVEKLSLNSIQQNMHIALCAHC